MNPEPSLLTFGDIRWWWTWRVINDFLLHFASDSVPSICRDGIRYHFRNNDDNFFAINSSFFYHTVELCSTSKNKNTISCLHYCDENLFNEQNRFYKVDPSCLNYSEKRFRHIRNATNKIHPAVAKSLLDEINSP